MIREIYAFVNFDENGDEAVIGVVGKDEHGGDMSVPLICHKKEMLEQMKVIAQQAANADGKKVRLVKLSTRKVVEEYLPDLMIN